MVCLRCRSLRKFAFSSDWFHKNEKNMNQYIDFLINFFLKTQGTCLSIFFIYTPILKIAQHTKGEVIHEATEAVTTGMEGKYCTSVGLSSFSLRSLYIVKAFPLIVRKLKLQKCAGKNCIWINTTFGYIYWLISLPYLQITIEVIQI